MKQKYNFDKCSKCHLTFADCQNIHIYLLTITIAIFHAPWTARQLNRPKQKKKNHFIILVFMMMMFFFPFAVSWCDFCFSSFFFTLKWMNEWVNLSAATRFRWTKFHQILNRFSEICSCFMLLNDDLTAIFVHSHVYRILNRNSCPVQSWKFYLFVCASVFARGTTVSDELKS